MQGWVVRSRSARRKECATAGGPPAPPDETVWWWCRVPHLLHRGSGDHRRGIPQGSPLSPLLANIYMRRFVLGWKKLGLERSLGTRLVTYADDLVILCRRGNAEAALHRLREIMGKLRLTVNEDKTRICKVPEGEFDFLGYTFGRLYSPRTGQARLGQRPSKKSIKRAVETVHELTVRAHTWQETTELVGKLYRTLVALQAQDQTKQGQQLSTLAPLRDLRARASDPAWTRRAVDEGVKSCPRARCGMWR